MSIHKAYLKVRHACRLLREALEQLPKDHPLYSFLVSLLCLASELAKELEKDVEGEA